MPDKDLGAVFDSKVKRGVEGKIPDLGVDIGIHAEQEDERFHIVVQHGQMEEVLSTTVNLKPVKDHMTKEITCQNVIYI